MWSLPTRTIGGSGKYADNFPRNPLSGLLMIAAGLILALSASTLGQSTSPAIVPASPLLSFFEKFISGCLVAAPWLTAVSMLVLGLCRMQGKQGWMGFGGLICLFYMIMLVNNYRLWSANPHFQDYAYQLLAGVLLMLCSFHRACCDAGIIQRRKLLFTGLTAAFCAIVSLSIDFQRGFYLASALWALGSVCTVSQLRADPEDAPEKNAAETEES